MLSRPNILVCSDFTAQSRVALMEAERLRKCTNGKIYHLHVCEFPASWDWQPQKPFDQDDKTFTQYIHDKQVQEIASCKAIAEPLFSFGGIKETVEKEVEKHNIQLIVLGHVPPSPYPIHLGSTAEKILVISHVPVYIVNKSGPVNRIAALIDPVEQAQPLLGWAEELSYLLSSELFVVSLFPDMKEKYFGFGKLGFSTKLLSIPEEEKTQIISTLKEKFRKELSKSSNAKLRLELSTEKKTAYHLQSILEQEKIDLAVMKRYQSGFYEKILIGSETRRMVEIFNGNLFILPP